MGQESSSSSPMNETTVVRSSASTSQQLVDVGRYSLSYLVRFKVTAFVAEICYAPRIFLIFDLHPRLLAAPFLRCSDAFAVHAMSLERIRKRKVRYQRRSDRSA